MAESSPKGRGGGLRCHHCAGPLSKDITSGWNLLPLIRDSFSMIGSTVGGTSSAFYGFNLALPVVRRSVTGPMWLHFLVGASVQALFLSTIRAPPVILFSSACAGLTGGTLPALAQLTSSSYHAAISSPLPPSSAQHDKIHKSRASSTL